MEDTLRSLDRFQWTTILTLIYTSIWLGTAVVRIWVDWPEAVVVDKLMAPIAAWWFISAKKNGTA